MPGARRRSFLTCDHDGDGGAAFAACAARSLNSLPSLSVERCSTACWLSRSKSASSATAHLLAVGAASLDWALHRTRRHCSAVRRGLSSSARGSTELGSDQTSATLAQGLNAVIFSLTAIPVYFIASRVLQRRYALLAALLAVVLPSCVLTSAIMTENAFYPLFATSALLMLRALERPSVVRQLLVAASTGAAFLVRARRWFYSVLPARGRPRGVTTSRADGVGLAASLRQQAPQSPSASGRRRVSDTSTLDARSVSRSRHLLWPPPFRPLGIRELGRPRALPGCHPAGGVRHSARPGVVVGSPVSGAAQARASHRVSRGRPVRDCRGAFGIAVRPWPHTHERNLFFLAPLVLISFFAWLDAGLPSTRHGDGGRRCARAAAPDDPRPPSRRRGRRTRPRGGKIGTPTEARSPKWCWSQRLRRRCSSYPGDQR